MSGPSRKPNEIRKIQGTERFSKQQGGRMEPMKLVSVPDPPEYLGEYGRALWERQLSQLVALKMLTVVDLTALGRYCEAWNTWRESVDKIREVGLENQHGQVNAHYSNKKEANNVMLKLEDRFGFLPSAREKLSMPEGKSEDPLEAHLNKNTG